MADEKTHAALVATAEQLGQARYFAGLQKVGRTGLRADSIFDGNLGQQVYQGSGGGWANPATGLGTFARDKVLQGAYSDPFRIPDPELAALFNGNDIAKKIVSIKPKEMFRRGYSVNLPDPKGDKYGQGANAEAALGLEKYAANLGANDKIKDGMIWGRLFGGAVVIIGADDGAHVSTPLQEDRIRSIKFLNVVDRRFLFARTYYGDHLAPKFGEVETYQVTNSYGGNPASVIHESRVLRFDGSMVDLYKMRQLAGWSYSTLQAVYDTMRQFDQSFQSIANLMSDMSQAVMKINGLMQMIANDSAGLQTRMAMVDMTRSSGRMVILDAENEDFERKATPLSGVPETLQLQMIRLACAAEIPVCVLFGQSPAGMNATGESDFRNFYGNIASDQKNELEPVLDRLYRLICLAQDGPTGGKIPAGGLEFKWHKLKEPTESELADIYGKTATADCAYVAAGVLFPEEVALSRFRCAEFRQDTDIDIEVRKTTLAHELDFSEQSAEQKATIGPVPPEAAPVPLPASAGPDAGK